MPVENIAEWVLGPYVGVLGNWFWAVILFAVVAIVYLRTESIGPALLTLLIGATIFRAVLPGGEFQVILFFAVVFGIAYAFFRLFVRKEYGG